MPKITCTDEQLGLIETCIEAMFRMSMGQMDHGIETLCALVGREIECDKRKCLSRSLRAEIFPELVENASYGFSSKENGRGKELYEMYKVLQNFRASKDNHPEYSVTHTPPLRCTKNPLIEVSEWS